MIPYLRSKALDLYERLGGGADSDLFRDSPNQSRDLELVRLSLPSPPLSLTLSIAATTRACTQYDQGIVQIRVSVRECRVRTVSSKLQHTVSIRQDALLATLVELDEGRSEKDEPRRLCSFTPFSPSHLR